MMICVHVKVMIKQWFSAYYITLSAILIGVSCVEETAITGCPSHCPRGCICSDAREVICNSAGMGSIPASQLPKNTVYLSMTSNNILLLTTRFMANFTRLRTLILDKNYIYVIQKEAFGGLKNMEEISLQNNPLRRLDSGSMSGLSNIKNLHLGHNEIALIEPDAFANSENIQTISLRGNPLNRIEDFAFRDLKGVGTLYLPEGIKRIEPQAFDGLCGIADLQLEGLQLSVLPRKAFTGMCEVKSLTIRNSTIGTFDHGVFMNTSNVGSINVEDCTIRTILKGAFSHLLNVSELRVVGNRITNFHPGAFGESTFAEVGMVKIQNNFVPCDCRIRWFRSLSDLLPSIAHDNFCSLPDDKLNERVSTVFLADLEDDPTCDPYYIPPGGASHHAMSSLAWGVVWLSVFGKRFIII